MSIHATAENASSKFFSLMFGIICHGSVKSKLLTCFLTILLLEQMVIVGKYTLPTLKSDESTSCTAGLLIHLSYAVVFHKKAPYAIASNQNKNHTSLF